MGYGRPPGPRVSRPRPAVDNSSVDISGWKVLDWRYIAPGTWCCSLIQPDGTLYNPDKVISVLIKKRAGEECFTIYGTSEEMAKKSLRNFLLDTQAEINRKTKEPETFSFADGGVIDVKHDLLTLREELAKKSEELWNIPSQSDPATKNAWAELNKERAKNDPRKSLWQEWKEKRAERKAAKSQTVDDKPED